MTKDAAILEWTGQHPDLPHGPGEDGRLGPLGLTSFGTHALTQVFGLEVVIVSLAATIDEAVTGIIFLIIPPSTKKSHAETRIFWQIAYVCREMPELRI